MHKHQSKSIALHLAAGVDAHHIGEASPPCPARACPSPAARCDRGRLAKVAPRDGPPRGFVAPGALADLILVDGDPLEDPSVLMDETNIKVVIKGGRVVKDIRSIAPVVRPRVEGTVV